MTHAGIIRIYGDAANVGGQTRYYPGALEDTPDDYFIFGAQDTYMSLGGLFTGPEAFKFYASGAIVDGCGNLHGAGRR